MKKTIFFLPVFFFYHVATCQINKQLCKPGEEVVFTFQYNNKKTASVCKAKNDDYLVYRFGTVEKIELEFPDKLDSASWQKFSFKGYLRGGGKQNAAMSYGYLHFENDNVKYEIYDTWDSEDDKQHCGILLTMNNKGTDMPGLVKTKKGSLLSLMDTKVKMEEEQ